MEASLLDLRNGTGQSSKRLSSSIFMAMEISVKWYSMCAGQLTLVLP